MPASQSRRNAFSSIELLVVLLIIAIIIAMLLPAIFRARGEARATACLASIQQWDYMFQAYLSTNRNKSIRNQTIGWWEALAPFSRDARQSLLCPDARDPLTLPPAETPSGLIDIRRGSASNAWVEQSDKGRSLGSYGFNANLLDFAHGPPKGFFGLPATGSSNIPVFSDCILSRVLFASTRDTPPKDLINPEESNGIPASCLNRHRMTVNVAFLDGHAERISLAGLWKLKWSPDSVPRDLTVR